MESRGARFRMIGRLVLFTAVWVFGGCGEKKPTTPEACIQAFDAAMRSGDTARAAALFAYDKWSADHSTDWDTYARSQRDLIRSRLRQEKAGQLQSWRSIYLQGNYRPTAVRTSGEWAYLVLSGPRGSLPVRLYQQQGEWLIYSIGNLQAGS